MQSFSKIACSWLLVLLAAALILTGCSFGGIIPQPDESTETRGETREDAPSESRAPETGEPASSETQSSETGKPAETDRATESEKQSESESGKPVSSETERQTETETTKQPESETQKQTETETNPPSGPVIYNIIPDCAWGNDTRSTAEGEYTLGDGAYPITFRAIDVSGMKYLELDLYVPDATNIKKLTTNTQFEITSSGACDKEEHNWTAGAFLNGVNIVSGWNHIKKTLPTSSACDMTRVNYMRWYWVSPASTIPGCKIANLRFTTDGSVEPEREVYEFTPMDPFIPMTVYPTEDVPVALIDLTKAPYNADSTGQQDVTNKLNAALKHALALGGGTVFLPAGKYRVTGTISIPEYVTLRGDWQNPDTGTEYGTVILADVKSEEATGDNSLFYLAGSAGVYGLTVYYPGQSLTNVKPYPFTFYTGDQMLASVQYCTVINGYQGVGACALNGVHEMFTLDHFYGTFLKTGAELRNSSDVGTCQSVYVNPKYWAESPLNPAQVKLADIQTYTRANTIGLLIGDLEWTEFTDIQIESCKYGVQITKGVRIDFAGSFFGSSIQNCGTAVKLDALDTRWGMTIANTTLGGSDYSLLNSSGGIVKMVNVTASSKVQGSVTRETATGFAGYEIPSRTYVKPAAKLYVFDGDKTGSSDVSASLQALLQTASATGGVVYLPGGYYLLNQAITVPSGVELRGSAGSPARDQSRLTKGTVILATYGDSSAATIDQPALITLQTRSGIQGIRIAFYKNGPLNNANVNTVYAIRGTGADVYCVNCAILAAAHGVDFSNCDRHYIRKLVTACYYNTMKVGGNDGIVEGCLQNGTVMQRISSTFFSKCENWITGDTLFNGFFDPITRKVLAYLIIGDGTNQLVYNTFAYGPYDFLTNQGNTGAVALNVGSDNIGGTQTVQQSGSLTVAGALRWNGRSYQLKGGSLNLYARLTINNKDEGKEELVYTPTDPGTPVTVVKPNTPWANATKDNPSSAFKMGDSVNGFKFDAVDLSEMNFIEFDLYVPSVDNLNQITTNSEFEISSSGTCDVQEHQWAGGTFLNGQNIQAGWNHVKVGLSGLSGTNPENINWIRWYWVEPKATISGCKVANLRFTAS